MSAGLTAAPRGEAIVEAARALAPDDRRGKRRHRSLASVARRTGGRAVRGWPVHHAAAGHVRRGRARSADVRARRTQEAAAVVDTAYNLAGSNAIFEDGPFERRFRDVHAVSQQLQARRGHYETVGAFLLGLEPNRAFL